MTPVYLAIGSNLGDRKKHLIDAINLLHSYAAVEAIAPLYETSAYGMTDQPSFLNSALRIKTKQKPEELLATLKEIEKKVGRKKRVRWGPREIDLDIIFFDDLILNSPDLFIPHPDFHNRRFVLKPLRDLDPDFISPSHRKSISELLTICHDLTNIELIERDWYPQWT